ncbi:MAG: hypothetical protein VW875_06865 [Planctomycetaceae bacterium]
MLIRKHQILYFIVATLLFSSLSGCGSNYGTLLEFNGGELYYTSNVSQVEASRLGSYLVSEQFFDGSRKTVQLDNNSGTYEFRMVVKKGMEDDQEFLQIAKQTAADLSQDVFGGSPVDIHLCDERLETLRVVVNF